eukprot:3341712-Amphidinium_carterae.1
MGTWLAGADRLIRSWKSASRTSSLSSLRQGSSCPQLRRRRHKRTCQSPSGLLARSRALMFLNKKCCHDTN